MKKKNKIFISISILIIVIIGLIVIFFTRKDNNVDDKTDKVLTKEEYYDELLVKLEKVYEEYYKRISVSQSYDDITLVVKLGQLEQDGIDIKEFVSYKTNVACDKIETYGKYKLKNGKYDLSLIYKCDNDTNYKEESIYKIDLN